MTTKTEHTQPQAKRIRITVEWYGACSEMDWADSLAHIIEQADASRMTRIAGIERLTSFGTTEPTDVDKYPIAVQRPTWRREWWWRYWR